MPSRLEISELISATRANGSKDSTVFGSGLVMKRGRITSINKIIRGYMERGRTRVPPPMPPGNKGKLLTGSVTKKRIQQIFEIESINLVASIERQLPIINILCG